MNTDELRRLNSGPLPGEKSRFGLERFFAHCKGNAPEVLARCKEVLTIVLAQDVERWPSDEEWISLLPDWFVAECADEDPPATGERDPSDTRWTAASWVFWFLPDERQWFWWTASILDAGTIEVLVEVYGHPYPWGSLEWVLRASGATRVELEY